MGSHRRSPVGAQPRRGTTSNGSISSSSSNLSDAVDRRSGISPCSRARLWSPVLALALVVSALTGAVPVALGDPVQFTDQYTPRCTPVAVPPPGGYQRWSSSSTWGGRPIPGVGSQQMVNVTIPCGQAVLLDVPQVRLNTLTVRGLLSVLDPPATQTAAAYNVTACFILVEGQMVIGTAAKQFRSKIVFTLAPNPNGRAEYSGSFNPPADPENPRGLGHKAFVVMGGYVDFHGMPGGGDTPSWVKLAETAAVGQNFIIVDTDVSAWPLGSKIAVASTGFYHDQAEDFLITKIDPHPKGGKITLNKAFTWMHFGDAKGIPDGFGGFVDERAEVALLSRNIVLTGVDEPPPYQYEGGHFMVFMTNTPQAIEGVEYYLMGQQGNLGRYNIHIHICGDTRGTFTIRKNSIHSSKQRCVVVHSTHNLTIDSNVAYNTSGHCYMVEEGGEQDNLFVNNLGIMTNRVDRLILDGPTPGTTQETDNVASTFWITNLYNSYVGNVAAGSDDSGFWFELRNDVRGMTTQIPGLKTIKPSASQFKVFKNNVAHSNHAIGFRLYPHGVNPRNESNRNSNVSEWKWGVGNGRMEGLLAYKNGDSGLFIHSSRNIYVSNSTFADNRYGVELVDNYNCSIINSRFVGASQNNLDTIVPAWCNSPNGPWLCGPIQGCKLDLKNVTNLRYTGGFSWMEPRFGVLIHHSRIVFDGYGPFNITGNSFFGYDSSCGQPRAALGAGLIGISNDALEWWNSGQFAANTKLAPGVNPVWYPPATYTLPTTGIMYMPNETGRNYAIWDKDGSLIGGAGGYIVGTTDPFLKPPARVSCSGKDGTNSMNCRGTCYRTLYITYVEEGFDPSPSYSSRKRGDFSFITLKRSDGASRVTDGNLNDLQATKNTRHFINTVYAPATYEITITPPNNKPNWVPKQLQIGYRDGGGCGQTVTVILNQPLQGSYDVTFLDDHWWRACPGVASNSSVQVSRVCRQGASALSLALVGEVPVLATVVSSPSSPPPCSVASRCGVYPGADTYWFTNAGLELHADYPGGMGFNMPTFPLDASWQQGKAMIGYQGSPWDGLTTFVRPARPGVITYYYRKSFTLKDSSCFSGIYLDFYILQGLVAYLNGIEIFRFNVPNITLTNTTLSLGAIWWPNGEFKYNSTYIDLSQVDADLVEGTNFVAFETHIGDNQKELYFDTRLALNLSSSDCRGALKTQEQCDGLDNDNDGRVDGNSTGVRLSRSCSNACGTGVETCLNGAYQGCTAPAIGTETCNGKDEDCDGIVDDNVVCPASNSFCIAGACKVPVAPKSTLLVDNWQPWKVLDATLPKPPSDWMSPSFDDSGWLNKRAVLGNNRDEAGTIKMQRPRYGYYFRKTITVPDGQCYYSLSSTFYALDGAVFYVNGAEIHRFQMDPSITRLTASTPSGDVGPVTDNGKFTRTGQWLRKGANVVAVEMHISSKNTGNFYFDIQLTGLKEAGCS